MIAVVLSQGVRVAVARSLHRDVGNISEWCGLDEVKWIEIKTKIMIASKSRTMHLQSLALLSLVELFWRGLMT